MPTLNDSQWGRYAGMGMEVAGGVAVGYVVGWLLERGYGWHAAPLIGMFLGIGSGMYLLIKQALQMNRDDPDGK
jgi:F0F1-type ATP synthase assembly protein I